MYEFGKTVIKIREEKGYSLKREEAGYSTTLVGISVPEKARELVGASKKVYRIEIPNQFRNPITNHAYFEQPNKDELITQCSMSLRRIELLKNVDDPSGEPFLSQPDPDLVSAYIQWLLVTKRSHFTFPNQGAARDLYERLRISPTIEAVRAEIYLQRFKKTGRDAAVVLGFSTMVEHNTRILQVSEPIKLNIVGVNYDFVTTEQLPDGSIMHIPRGHFGNLTFPQE